MADETTPTAENVTEYVVGFALDSYGRVALIRKNRPEWQAGLLNGIGGHIEPGETPDAAMVREFEEETGRKVGGWQKFVVMEFPAARIHFFRARIGTAVMEGLRTTTDEVVCKLDARDLAQVGVIPNLRWLVPLAAYTADEYQLIHVRAAVAEAVEPPAYPAGHGWTPHTGPFATGDACRVMLARYPCNYTREQHDPALPPVDVDVFGYRRNRAGLGGDGRG